MNPNLVYPSNSNNNQKTDQENQNNQDNNQNVPILNIEQLNNCLNLITESLSTSCKQGQFNLNEAYTIKIASTHLDKAIKTLDRYQKLFIQVSKRQEELDKLKSEKNVDVVKLSQDTNLLNQD